MRKDGPSKTGQALIRATWSRHTTCALAREGKRVDGRAVTAPAAAHWLPSRFWRRAVETQALPVRHRG
jgi:phosphoketolase